MERYREAHRRSLDDREGYWSEQAKLVDWRKPFTRALDYSRPPFAKWFVGGTNQSLPQRDRSPPRERAAIRRR